MKVILVCLMLFCLSLIVDGARTRKPQQRPDSSRKSSRIVGERKAQMVRAQRKERARTAVISCRVFKQGTCNKSRQNIISSNPSVKSKSRCQQLCFATQGCTVFTFHEEGNTERPPKMILVLSLMLTEKPSGDAGCVLFKDCRGKREVCDNCISGPIMPRINECLAGTESEFYEGDEDKLAEESQSLSFADDDYDYSSNDNAIDTEDYDYDYSYDDYDEGEVLADFPLEDSAIELEEEEEEGEINIDEGFLNDVNNEAVVLPKINTRSNVVEPRIKGPVQLIFVLIGGLDADGATINTIDTLNTGLGSSAPGLTLAPLPLALTQGGECSSALTERSITSCGGGVVSLSPYGYQHSPGSCYAYDLQSQRWEARGGRMTSYRKGASVTKLGRYLIASGGRRQKRSLNSMEVFDPAKPKAGWRRLARLRMPTGVSEHCTVVVSGKNGKEIVITGGRARKNRAMKLNLRTKRWYALNGMNKGRQNHACVKASLNGHPGVIVSGGYSSGNTSLTSVEFYNAKTGTWLQMPSMKKARSGHVMTITKGKLMVAGGERKGRSGLRILDDVEVFTGQRWVRSKRKLKRPRSRFSLLKIPKYKIAKKTKKITLK